MKQRLTASILALLMLFCLLPAAAFASVSVLIVGNTTITEAGSWITNSTSGKLTPTTGSNWNVRYDGNGILTLKGAKITGTTTNPEGAAIYARGTGPTEGTGLTLELVDTSTVTAVTASEAQLSVGVFVKDCNLTIKGTGTLVAEGGAPDLPFGASSGLTASNGHISITDNASVNAKCDKLFSSSGIRTIINPGNVGKITISTTGTVTATGRNIGIEAMEDITVSSGTVIATATGTGSPTPSAMNKAPTVYENAQYTASANEDGSSPVTYDPNNIASYRYLKIVPPATHTITASAGANGTITPSGDVEVTVGEDQAFIIEARAGYQIADVLVDGANEGAVATYTFTNVTADHTIEATFEELPTLAAPSITTQPQSQTVFEGQPVTFSVAATGNPAPTYKWYTRGPNGNAVPLGVTTASFIFPATTMDKNGNKYFCHITNSQGQVDSDEVTLTVMPAPAVIGTNIFANGVALIIKQTGGTKVAPLSTIYIDKNRDGVFQEGVGPLQSGEPSLKDANIENAPDDNTDLSNYNIYGGGNRTNGTYNTMITMLSGCVGTILGGGMNSTVTGNTSVTISGGTLNDRVFGGGIDLSSGGNLNGTVTGNTSVTISGGTISGSVYGGGNGSAVTDNSSIEISGGVVSGSVYGGGYAGTVSGTKTVSVEGAPVIGGIDYADPANTQGIRLDTLTDKKVTVSDALTSGAAINLMNPSVPASGTVVASAADKAHADTQYFTMQNTALKKVESGAGAEIQIDFMHGAPSVAGRGIFGNGSALIIKQTGDADTQTTVYIDQNRDGELQEGEPSLKEAGVSGAPENSADLSLYSVHGGGNLSSGTYNTLITMLSGKLGNIFGGGYGGTVTGSTDVEVRGGTVQSFVSGGNHESGAVTGSTNLEVSGGNMSIVCGGGVSGDYSATSVGTPGQNNTTFVHISGSAAIGRVLGGGQGIAPVYGSASVIISGGNVNTVCGGGLGTDSEVTGNTNVEVSGGTVREVYGGADNSRTPASVGTPGQNNTACVHISGSADVGTVYGGGCGSGLVYGSASVIISGGTVSGSVYGAGNDAVTGNTGVVISGGTVSGSVYGGGEYGSVTGNTSVTISGGTISGSVYGGGLGGRLEGGKVGGNTEVSISGGTVSGSVYGCGTGAAATVAGTKTVSVEGAPVIGGADAGIQLASLTNERIFISGALNGADDAIKLSTAGITVANNVVVGTATTASQAVAGKFAFVSAPTGYSLAADTTVGTVYIAADTYDVILNKNGGSADGSATATYGSATLSALTAPTRTGYTPTGYYTSASGGDMVIDPSGALVSGVSGYTDANGKWNRDADATLYAQWSTISYTVTYDTDGGTTISNGSYTIETLRFTLPTEPTKTGYTFAAWKVTVAATGGTGFALDDTFSTRTRPLGGSYGNVTLKAQWSAKSYAVALLKNGGSADGSVTATYDAALPAFAALTRTGYTLTGYYTAPSGGNKVIDASGALLSGVNGYTDASAKWIRDADATLYAQWSVKTYAVALLKNGGAADGSVTATYDAALPAFTALTRTGYTLTGYYTAPSGGDRVIDADGKLLSSVNGYTNANGKWIKDGDATLYAQWSAIYYSVTYDTLGGSSITPVNYTIETTDFALPAAPTKTGYGFTGWKVTVAATGGTGFALDTTFAASDTSVTLAASYGNVALTAQWTAKTYSVTLDAQGGTGGTTDINPTYDSAMPAITKPSREYTVTYNQNYTGAADTSDTAAYTFDGYYSETDGGGTQYYTAAGASAGTWDSTDITSLYADWTSADVTLPTPARTDYTFGGWYTQEACTTLAGMGGESYTPTADTTLYAKWEKIPVVYRIIDGENGEWTEGFGKGLTCKSDGDFAKFQSVSVDGNIIGSDCYTTEPGSTAVTLKASYLETLTVGRHTLRIDFTDGYAETTFTIKAAPLSPITGGHSMPWLWLGILALAAGSLAANIALAKKKRRAP